MNKYLKSLLLEATLPIIRLSTTGASERLETVLTKTEAFVKTDLASITKNLNNLKKITLTKIKYRYRTILFALIMSCNTTLIVSGIIIYLKSESHTQFIKQWLGAFITGWPIVFIAILVVAPLVNKLLNLFVEDH